MSGNERAEPDAQAVARAALIDAGFAARRHAGPVHALRRVLWPLVRPFLFHLLDEQRAAEARQAAETARLAELVARLDHLARRVEAMERQADALTSRPVPRSDFQAAMAGFTAQAAEARAVSVRQAWLESSLEALEARLAALVPPGES